MDPSKQFQNQAAVVTGAARGLGQAVARLLAERGATVILVDLDEQGVAQTARELADHGFAAHGFCADLCDEAALEALRAFVARMAGSSLDILVNNAGGWRHATTREITLEDWDWTFRTNTLSAFLTSRVLMDFLIEGGYGRIVNVASTDAHRAKPSLPHYAAAKAAVVSLTKSLAEELAPQGVLVNAVSPGAIATETAKQQSWFAERVKTIPVGYAAEPEDIAEVILFLASRQNRVVVGETIMANGGLLII